MANDVAAWLAGAVADAKARQLPELEPLLETLARSLQALRDADAAFGHPGIRVAPVVDESSAGAPAADTPHDPPA